MPIVSFGSLQEANNVFQENHHDKHHDTCPHNDDTQTHVHEFQGSTMIASENGETHNHRFAGVTSEVILVPGGHVHTFLVNSDFFDHHHEVSGTTELQTPVGDGKHVHYVRRTTTFDDGHDHDFQFATLIDSPLV